MADLSTTQSPLNSTNSGPASGAGKKIAIILSVVIILGLAGAFTYLKFGNELGLTGTETSSQTEETADATATTADTTTLGETTMTGTDATTSTLDFTTDSAGLSKATVTLQTVHGTIRFRFYSDDAPNTSRRIAELIQSGFYNGLTFHRVVPNFVVQGGDPVGNGTGGSGQKQKAEFNKRKHEPGTVAMARAADPDSADSQFYIALSTVPHLDNSYTVFGQVIEGMDIVRKIQPGDKMVSVKVE